MADSTGKLTTSLRVQILNTVSVLDGIREAPFVGAALEDAKMALHGGPGLASTQLRHMHLWASRWKALDGRLRALYGTSLRSGATPTPGVVAIRGDVLTEGRYVAVCIAVQKILKGGTPPKGSVYGALRDLWVDVYGYAPPIEMVPLPRESRE